MGSVGEILRVKGWFYLLLAAADVEANYLVVKAYKYTTITSVMLLDCFSIPCVMVLSFLFLKTRFRLVHYLGVVLCLAGLGTLIATDAMYNDHPGTRQQNIVLPFPLKTIFSLSRWGGHGERRSSLSCWRLPICCLECGTR